jgi:hypothetical protein
VQRALHAGDLYDQLSLNVVEKGTFGVGALEVDGIEAIGKDNSGNWFSMTDHRPAR